MNRDREAWNLELEAYLAGALDARERAAFEAEIDTFTAWVKASPPAPGVDAVMVPGDPERKARAERLAAVGETTATLAHGKAGAGAAAARFLGR